MIPFRSKLKIKIFSLLRIIIFIFLLFNEIECDYKLYCTVAEGSGTNSLRLVDYDNFKSDSPNPYQLCAHSSVNGNCPDDYPFKYAWSCAKKCSHIDKLYNTADGSNIKTYYYVPSPPESSNEKQCVINCKNTEKKKYLDPDTDRCVEKCSLTYNKYYYKDDVYNNTCLSKCNFRLEDENECFKDENCSDSHPNQLINEDGEIICYDICPKDNGKMFINETGFCVECKVGEGYFINKINEFNINDPDVHSKYFDIYENRRCSHECPEGYEFYRKNDNECFYSYGKSSCDEIPNNIFKFHHMGEPNICLANCNDYYFQIDNKYECFGDDQELYHCKYYYYVIGDISHCLEQNENCGKIGNYYIYNRGKRCEKNCTSNQYKIFHELKETGEFSFYGQCLDGGCNEEMIRYDNNQGNLFGSDEHPYF